MHRLYANMAEWWPLLSPPCEYVEEAEDLLRMIRERRGTGRCSLLELGCGGGSLASHLAPHFDLTLTDLSPDMAEVCRRTVPQAQVLVGDMRSLRLGRQFDIVLVHDAIMYATDAQQLRATFETAAAHCAPGGLAVFLPDCVRETFEPETDHGGHDDGARGLRFLWWSFDPDPDDSEFETHFAVLMREADGSVRVDHDAQRCGVFALTDWQRWLAEAGFNVETVHDPWRAYVFVCRR